MRQLALLIVALGAVLCHARTLKVAPEFTLTNFRMLEQSKNPRQKTSEEGLRLLRAWKAIIERDCAAPDCVIETTTVKDNEAFRVTFNFGWSMEVSQDPSVLEITMTPDTIDNIRSYRRYPDHFIFEIAKSLGLEAHERTGQNHLNIDRVSAFGGNDHLFGDFLADCANHPEWFFGIFGNHLGNAPPLMALSLDSRHAFEDVLRDYRYYNHTADWLAEQMNEKVYISNPWSHSKEFFPERGKEDMRRELIHNQGINLQHFGSPTPIAQRRVEWRGNRPDDNLDSFLLKCEFIQARISWLETRGMDQQIRWPRTYNMANGERLGLFKKTLDETGLSREKFLPLVWPKTVAQRKTRQDNFPVAVEERDLNPAAYAHLETIHANHSVQNFGIAANAAAESGSDNRRLKLLPKLISEQDNEQLLAGSKQRLRMLQALIHDLAQENPRAVAEGVIPLTVFASLKKYHYQDIDKVWIQHPNVGYVYSPDVVRDEHNKLVVIEDNCGSPGGQGDACASRHDLLNAMPEYRDVLSLDGERTFAQEMVSYFKTKIGKKRVLLLIDGDDVDSLRPYVEQFEEAGGLWDYYTTSRVSVNDKAVTFTENGKSYDIGAIVLRHVGQKEFRRTLPKASTLISAGKLFLVSNHQTIPNDKEWLVYADQLTRLYLNEEPILKTAVTYSFRKDTEALLDKVKASPRRFVVKPTNEGQGTGVYIGNQISTAWSEVKEKIKKSGAMWVAQERASISTLQGSITDFRTFQVLMGNGDIIQGPLVWSRAMRAWGDGRLNFSAQAGTGAVPVFRESELKYKDEYQKLARLEDPAQVMKFGAGNSTLAEIAALRLVQLDPTAKQLIELLGKVRSAKTATYLLNKAGQLSLKEAERAALIAVWRETKSAIAAAYEKSGRTQEDKAGIPFRKRLAAFFGGPAVEKKIFADADIQLEWALLHLLKAQSELPIKQFAVQPQDFKTSSNIRLRVARLLLTAAADQVAVDQVAAQWANTLDANDQSEFKNAAENKKREVTPIAPQGPSQVRLFGQKIKTLCERVLLSAE